VDQKQKETRLSLMRYWLFGIFVIVFAAVTVYAGIPHMTGLLIFKEPYYWAIIGITAGASVITFLIYRQYINRS
jgi:hypothetical protein